MLEQVFSDQLAVEVTPLGFLTVTCCTIGFGLLLSLLYVRAHRTTCCTEDMPVVLAIVPAAVAIVILMVGRNVTTALGIGGIFVLTRFRSGPVQTKDLAYLFIAISLGTLCGCGFVAYGAVFVCVMMLLIGALEAMHWGRQSNPPVQLKIWVPETLNFQDAFTPVLNTYFDYSELVQVKTTDFGALIELEYRAVPKTNMNQKALLDEIRTRNGNMNVVLVTSPSGIVRR